MQGKRRRQAFVWVQRDKGLLADELFDLRCQEAISFQPAIL